MASTLRILPRGLYGRAALILIVPIVTIQLVVSTAFIQRQYEGVTRQMTQGVAIDLEYLLAQVEAGPDVNAARRNAESVGGALKLGVFLPPGTDAPRSDKSGWLDFSGQVMINTLRSELPTLVAADVNTDDRQVNLLFQTGKGPLQVTVQRRRMSASNSHQLLVVMLLTSMLMTVIAYLFLRNQLRPITKLAAAAEAFGKGQTFAYKPRGAIEVRAAGRAFMDMRNRIERQIEQRTQMLSGVSHDLRTPLTRLRLGLSLMPDDDDVKALQADVTQMQRMVEEFLAFARGDALEGLTETDPKALLQAVIDRADRGINKLRPLVVTGKVRPLRLRPQAVERAVENLIANAQRHGMIVEVRLNFQEKQLRIEVADDGPGIPKEKREEALRPFARLGNERDPNRGGGVGLGLSIAADIATSHGGALVLDTDDALGGLKAILTLAS